MQKERKIGLICGDTQSHSGAGKKLGFGGAPPIGIREMENSRIKAAPHDGISEGANQSTRVPVWSMIASVDHVHAASGACLSGGVQVGRKSHIGVGASCIQNISIGEECLIGGGRCHGGNFRSLGSFGGPSKNREEA